MKRIKLRPTLKVPHIHLPLGKYKWWNYIASTILITLLTWGLSHIILFDLESITAFASSNKTDDFEISDIYNTIADYRQVSMASPNVTVVAADNCSRQELMDLLEMVSAYQPNAIGLDIFFRTPNNDSAYIINTLQSIPNLVLPTILQLQTNQEYERIAYSFVEQTLSANYAYVNLNAANPNEVVRDFTPYLSLANGDTIEHIATKMAKIVAIDKYHILQQRDNPIETIHFSSISIPIISAQDILYGNDDAYITKVLSNRAVLIGDTANINDMYSTPTGGRKPGIIIHAHALHTILTQSYVTTSPTWLNWVIAFVLSILFIFLDIVVKDKWLHLGNMIMRIVQIALMFILVFIGAFWYNTHLQYIDFSPLILMIGFSQLAADIYDGILAIYLKIITRKQQKK